MPEAEEPYQASEGTPVRISPEESALRRLLKARFSQNSQGRGPEQMRMLAGSVKKESAALDTFLEKRDAAEIRLDGFVISVRRDTVAPLNLGPEPLEFRTYDHPLAKNRIINPENGRANMTGWRVEFRLETGGALFIECGHETFKDMYKVNCEALADFEKDCQEERLSRVLRERDQTINDMESGTDPTS